MSETTPLPELHQSHMDSETLAAYFRDLEACAEIFAVIPKMGQGYVAPQEVDLRLGKSLLESGALLGLQIRYRFDGSEWWDTLIARGGQIRITRIEQTFQ
ncbi:hypothetical protein [Pelagicoccus sp. SDUM812003]|uniref:hypothetical protein n=1 Tax=Pelagicoccus sp. SDUM812003 TaxID=3041267 RepID=UPI0028107387|nr:hypothetical protein [Pelagicoccus sp. SDUM812003]MDQ8202416.1 hypothetical protein [Pelagicoccus sp. SDUM812003]